MKKFKLLLLTMLIFVFTLTLGLGTMVAFAEEPDSTDYKSIYTNLFTREDCTIDVDATRGLKFTIDKDGYFNSMYHLSIGEEGEYFVSSAEVVVTGITNSTSFTELFEIKLVSGATSNQSATDRIRFFYKAASQDSAEAVCVKFNNDITEYKLNLTTITPDGTSDKVLVIPEFKVNIVPTTETKNDVEQYFKEVRLEAKDTANESVFAETKDGIGTSVLLYPYAKLTVEADVNVTFYLKEIWNLQEETGTNNLVSSKKVDFATNVINYGVDYYFNKYDGFFARDNAVAGYKYTADFIVYDFLSNVKKQIVITRIHNEAGDAVTEEPITITSAEVCFPATGTYKVVLQAYSEKKYEGNTATYEDIETIETYKVVSQYTKDKDAISYYKQDEDLEIKELYRQINENLMEKVGEDGSKLSVGSNFTYPSVSEVIKSKYFDVSTLTKTLYYASGDNADSYTSTTNSYFEASSISTYRYFVLFSDSLGNGLTYDELKEEDKYSVKTVNNVLGWYDSSDKLIVPVYEFTIQNNSAPEITLGTENNAFIGKSYKVQSISINGTSYETEYELYFINEANFAEITKMAIDVEGDGVIEKAAGVIFNRSSFKDADKNFDTNAYNKVLEYLVKYTKADGTKLIELIPNLEDLTDDNRSKYTDAFDTTQLTFTPKKGHYFLKCVVNSSNGMGDYVITEAISALTTPKSPVWEKEFFKNNWKSIVLFGVSILCCVGIVLILVIKPKKKTENTSEEV